MNFEREHRQSPEEALAEIQATMKEAMSWPPGDRAMYSAMKIIEDRAAIVLRDRPEEDRAHAKELFEEIFEQTGGRHESLAIAELFSLLGIEQEDA